MPDTGYNWDADWSVIDAAIALTQGGTIFDESAEIDLDGKAACLISFDTDYSNHAKATAGLSISILSFAEKSRFLYRGGVGENLTKLR